MCKTVRLLLKSIALIGTFKKRKHSLRLNDVVQLQPRNLEFDVYFKLANTAFIRMLLTFESKVSIFEFLH